MGRAQASRQGILAGTLKTKVRYLGAAEPRIGLRRRKMGGSQGSLECMAHDGAILEVESEF